MNTNETANDLRQMKDTMLIAHRGQLLLIAVTTTDPAKAEAAKFRVFLINDILLARKMNARCAVSGHHS